ncbi:Shikimate 5-dehydrogenase I alpha [hydrothermal vent metagenome]|uniref:Shikimate 5-dehydrogenase I alpha n=1 Tax=hydrothermal vent metagenome TaxID=652676 RepID=A0A3B1DS13_9ZZZZ
MLSLRSVRAHPDIYEEAALNSSMPTPSPTLLCVPLMVEQVDTARAEAIRAAEHGADLVEYRVDHYFRTQDETPELLRLVEESPLPCIVTCRPTWEGGHYEGAEEDRLALFQALGSSDHPPRYLDVELQALAKSPTARRAIHAAVEHPESARDIHTRLILSTHDFQGRPADLTRRLLAMHQEPAASICKVAFRARSLRDNLELFDMLAERMCPTIALGMGEFGLMSRVLAPKFGGFLTFASLRDESATAPGQPTLDDLLKTYRFRSIGPATRVYGIVGWPVTHSLSPLIHNAGFAEVGYDGVYLPMPIAAVGPASSRCQNEPHADAPAGSRSHEYESSYTSFKATIIELLHHPRLDFAGCSVTMPHKENLVRLARECSWSLDEVSRLSGSANTLTIERTPEGAFASARVTNTDAAAAIDCLTEPLGRLPGKRITLLGAGGVARAITFALAAAGARVTITNRTSARAEQLANDINTAFPDAARVLPWDDRGLDTPDAFIHCTAIGMAGGPAPDDSPLPDEVFAQTPGNVVLLETVYTPVRTRLLSQAQDAGWQTIDGLAMFVDQGARQFHSWTGHPAPRECFCRLVRTALNG